MILDNLNVIVIHGVISTDDIIPAHYKHKFADPSVLAKHVFENKFPGLSKSIKQNSVLVCDATFGIGSSREQAVSSLMAAGIVAILAPNFGRIFFRNGWNLGLVLIEIDTHNLLSEHFLSISLEQNTIFLSNKRVDFKPVAKELISMFICGGLLEYVKSI